MNLPIFGGKNTRKLQLADANQGPSRETRKQRKNSFIERWNQLNQQKQSIQARYKKNSEAEVTVPSNQPRGKPLGYFLELINYDHPLFSEDKAGPQARASKTPTVNTSSNITPCKSIVQQAQPTSKLAQVCEKNARPMFNDSEVLITERSTQQLMLQDKEVAGTQKVLNTRELFPSFGGNVDLSQEQLRLGDSLGDKENAPAAGPIKGFEECVKESRRGNKFQDILEQFGCDFKQSKEGKQQKIDAVKAALKGLNNPQKCHQPVEASRPQHGLFDQSSRKGQAGEGSATPSHAGSVVRCYRVECQYSNNKENSFPTGTGLGRETSHSKLKAGEGVQVPEKKKLLLDMDKIFQKEGKSHQPLSTAKNTVARGNAESNKTEDKFLDLLLKDSTQFSQKADLSFNLTQILNSKAPDGEPGRLTELAARTDRSLQKRRGNLVLGELCANLNYQAGQDSSSQKEVAQVVQQITSEHDGAAQSPSHAGLADRPRGAHNLSSLLDQISLEKRCEGSKREAVVSQEEEARSREEGSCAQTGGASNFNQVVNISHFLNKRDASGAQGGQLKEQLFGRQALYAPKGISEPPKSRAAAQLGPADGQANLNSSQKTSEMSLIKREIDQKMEQLQKEIRHIEGGPAN